MSRHVAENKTAWLLVGVLAGICISYFWPHEPARAEATDRNDKFAMATVNVKEITAGGINDTLEGIFVLDFLTGQLRGAVLNNQTGKFSHTYMRNIAQDFQVNPQAEPKYGIVAGKARVPSQGSAQAADGVIYVGELRSGRVMAYAFPYAPGQAAPTVPLQPIDGFQFREAVQ